MEFNSSVSKFNFVAHLLISRLMISFHKNTVYLVGGTLKYFKHLITDVWKF